jgi:ABC-type multidrug transport system fused ATPase/permease subunit
MNAINSALTALNNAIDTGVAYLQANAVAILALLAIAYFIRNKGTIVVIGNEMKHDWLLARLFAAIIVAIISVGLLLWWWLWLTIIFLYLLYVPCIIIQLSAIKNSRLASTGHVLAQDRSAAHNATSREEEIRQVRLQQQEIANERAKQAAVVRKEREMKERERKNMVAKKKYTGGNKLGGGDDAKYHPMQPSTANSSGYRYVTLRCFIVVVFLLFYQSRRCHINLFNTSRCVVSWNYCWSSLPEHYDRPARRTVRRGWGA